MRLVFLTDLHFICIVIDAIKSELLTLTFKSEIVKIWALTKLSPFCHKANTLTAIFYYKANTLTAIFYYKANTLTAILHSYTTIIIYSRGQNRKKIVKTTLWLNH